MEGMEREKRAKKPCSCRHENGNCLPVGGFCTSVPTEYCVMARKLEEYKATNATPEECKEALALLEKQKAGLVVELEEKQ